jgi:RNAse (barnase) inhibitor barstar
MTHADFLRDPVRSGVYRLPDAATWVARAAKANRLACWRVDLAKIGDKAGLLTALARALDFPDWFGGNWDALQDCLGDLSWTTAPGYVVVLEHCQGLAVRARADFETLLEVLGGAADYWRKQGIPFWVLVGGVSEGLCDLPRVGKGA